MTDLSSEPEVLAAPEDPEEPHVVILAGGTASRSLTIALIRQGVRVTRIVPAWDSGGSSKLIREKLHILSVGDVRQALMTMAYAEGHAGDIVRIFNARLSESGSSEELARELAFYSAGEHPAFQQMPEDLAEAILGYLRCFISAVGPDFDWRRGSIGNFILSGALLVESGDINSAILTFKALCGIRGDVWPVSKDNGLTLVAVLNDGRHIEGQHLITALSDADAATGIKTIALARAAANPRASTAILAADAVIYGPGSFYTSVLPHLLVTGIAETIDRLHIPKILIGNMLEDAETRGLPLEEMIRRLDQVAEGKEVLTHVLAHRSPVPVERVVGASRFVSRSTDPVPGKEIIVRDLEYPWHRGQHDAGLLGDLILAVARKGL